MAKKSKREQSTDQSSQTVGVSEKAISRASGFEGNAARKEILMQLMQALHGISNLEEDEILAELNTMVEMLEGLNPQDGTETLLTAQMVAYHHAAMDCFQRAQLSGQTYEGRHENLKQAQRFLGT